MSEKLAARLDNWARYVKGPVSKSSGNGVAWYQPVPKGGIDMHGPTADQIDDAMRVEALVALLPGESPGVLRNHCVFGDNWKTGCRRFGLPFSPHAYTAAVQLSIGYLEMPG